MKIITIAQSMLAVLILPGLFFFCSCHTVREADETNASEESDIHMQQDTLILTGRIFVGGHEPFTVLVLEREDDGEVVLTADESLYKELWSHQNKNVTCTGTYVDDPLHGQSFYVTEYLVLK